MNATNENAAPTRCQCEQLGCPRHRPGNCNSGDLRPVTAYGIRTWWCLPCFEFGARGVDVVARKDGVA